MLFQVFCLISGSMSCNKLSNFISVTKDCYFVFGTHLVFTDTGGWKTVIIHSKCLSAFVNSVRRKLTVDYDVFLFMAVVAVVL